MYKLNTITLQELIEFLQGKAVYILLKMYSNLVVVINEKKQNHMKANENTPRIPN